MSRPEYRKIHILGGPGSGKSFVASQLSTFYGLPVFDLDDLFWDRRADRYGVRALEGRLIAWDHRYDADHLRRARLAIDHLPHKLVECKTMSEVVRALEK